MFVQREVLRSGATMTFGQTYELDLPKDGQLMGLVLYAHATQNAAPFLTAVKWRLIDYISKIEVIGDGAEIIKSYDGRQALAAAFYDDGREPPHLWRAYSGNTDRQWIPIHFGRRFLDEVYGLDLSRFNQVTLKITNDASSTEYNTHINLDIFALWLREAAASFAGYFREEEWKTWLPVAGAIEYSDLPISLPIRRILLRARPGVDTADAKNNVSLERLLDDIDFTFRTGQVRVFKGNVRTLGYLSMVEGPGRIEVRGAIDRTAGYGFETSVGYVLSAMGAPAGDADSISPIPNSYMRQDVQESAQESGARSGQGMLNWAVQGWGYMHNIPLWLARKEDLSDMLDPEAQRVAKVNISCRTGSTVSGTHDVARSAIILSRLVR